MYGLLVSLAAGGVVFAIVAFTFDPLAAILPGIIVAAVAFFFVTRTIGQRVQRELEGLTALLQARDVKGAKALLASLGEKYGSWQFLLLGQLQAQAGMIDYMTMKFDEALPQLQAGSFRNWQAFLCIGAIHHRKGRDAEAQAAFAAAEKVGAKEALIFLVPAFLRSKAGDRTGALEVLARGRKLLPEHPVLRQAAEALANQRPMDKETFSEAWYQIFPEDYVEAMMAKQGGVRYRPTRMPGPGFQPPRVSKKMRRGR